MYFGSWPPAAARKKYRFVTNKSKDFHKKRTPNTQNFRACGALKNKGVLLFSKGIANSKRAAGARKINVFYVFKWQNYSRARRRRAKKYGFWCRW